MFFRVLLLLLLNMLLFRFFQQVKWIRVLYSDFSAFARDQERLISALKTFDYIEGLVIKNKTGLLNNWRTSFDPQDPVQASHFVSDGRTLYCLELTKNLYPENFDTVNQVRHVHILETGLIFFFYTKQLSHIKCWLLFLHRKLKTYYPN